MTAVLVIAAVVWGIPSAAGAWMIARAAIETRREQQEIDSWNARLRM